MDEKFEMGSCYRHGCKRGFICLALTGIIVMIILQVHGLFMKKIRLTVGTNKMPVYTNRTETVFEPITYRNNSTNSSFVFERSGSKEELGSKHFQSLNRTSSDTGKINKQVLMMIKDIIQSDTTNKGKVSVAKTQSFDCPGVLRKINGVEDLLCMKAPKFLPDFKNPCWYSVEGKFRCLPYFQVIGMDKSGSTDLFDKIAKHPDVLKNDGALQKETMWWSWLRYGHWLNTGRKIEPFERYLRYFTDAAETIRIHPEANLITGDGTPMDIWDMSGWVHIPQNAGLKEPDVITPHLMRHVNPNTKLIIILRNPTERLLSDYFFLRQGIMTVQEFQKEVVSSIKRLHVCTRTSSLRACLYNRQLHVQSKARIHLGFYSIFVKDWLKVFPREQFYIVTTDHYSNNANRTLQQAFEFLGLRNLPQSDIEKIAGADRRYVTKNKAREMLPETKLILDRLYQAFNEELSAILENDEFLWTEQISA